MKNLVTIALGAALAVAAPLAHATPITGSIGFGGNGSYDPNSHIFTAGGPVGQFGPVFIPTDAYVNSAGTLSLTPFSLGTAATFYTFNAGSIAAGGDPVFTTTVGTGASAVTLSFNLTTLISDGINASGPGLIGTGTLSETGYSPTMGTFSLNTVSGFATFTSGVTAVASTPEPSSLVLLGSGLVSAAGMLVRRRRVV